MRVGAEVLMADGFSAFADKRVGVIVNQASVVDSIHVVDAMLAAGVDVTALFGPEHGVRGDAGAGVTIRDGRDAATGLPVYSLYGPSRKPDPEVLRSLDVLVFDIQDVGARFYTYISTMGLAMQAAAEAGVEFVVLDRPNPLGGEYVSGYVLEDGFESFVGMYPIPIAHGMTVGELARAIVGESWLDGLDGLDLTVVPLQNWTRSMRWPAIGRTWIPTSPNIPDYETASVYPGMCLLEAANVAEGRGTDAPFLQIGAPWVDRDRLAHDLTAKGIDGVRFAAVTFTPRSDPTAAPNPRLRDTEVHGVRIEITDDNALDPIVLGFEVLTALRDHADASGVRDFAGQPTLFRENSMRRLAGSDRPIADLRGGLTASDIVAAWRSDVQTFLQTREPYLLYK